MLLGKRIALLEQAQHSRWDAMSEAQLLASIDARYGAGVGDFLSSYMDGLPDKDLDVLAAGDTGQLVLAFAAMDRWQGEQA